MRAARRRQRASRSTPSSTSRSNKVAGNWAIVIDPDGNRVSFPDMSLEPTAFWQSTQTFFEYPVAWRVSIPSAGIDLDVAAAFDDQEFITLISKPSFWEGRVNVEGSVRGKPVARRGLRRAQRLHAVRGPRRLLRGGRQGRAQERCQGAALRARLRAGAAARRVQGARPVPATASTSSSTRAR